MTCEDCDQSDGFLEKFPTPQEIAEKMNKTQARRVARALERLRSVAYAEVWKSGNGPCSIEWRIQDTVEKWGVKVAELAAKAMATELREGGWHCVEVGPNWLTWRFPDKAP